jgi:hypothetical protein
VSPQPGWCVESGHEFAVGGAGCGEVFLAFVELLLKVEVVLFDLADALVEGVDVGGGAEPTPIGYRPPIVCVSLVALASTPGRSATRQ